MKLTNAKRVLATLTLTVCAAMSAARADDLRHADGGLIIFASKGKSLGLAPPMTSTASAPSVVAIDPRETVSVDLAVEISEGTAKVRAVDAKGAVLADREVTGGDCIAGLPLREGEGIVILVYRGGASQHLVLRMLEAGSGDAPEIDFAHTSKPTVKQAAKAPAKTPLGLTAKASHGIGGQLRPQTWWDPKKPKTADSAGKKPIGGK